MAKDGDVKSLNGVTMLRYAHIYRGRSSGGMEQYLQRLDSMLLERTEMTILKMHLVAPDSDAKPVEEKVGLGRVVWIPIPAVEGPRTLANLRQRLRVLGEIKDRDCGDATSSLLPRLADRADCVASHLRYRTMIAGELLAKSISAYGVQLVVFHWLNYEVGRIIVSLQASGIPHGVINHFENARFDRSGTRDWIERAAAVGGVSALDVPAWLQPSFVNLSDAVDTEFFSAERARPIDRPSGFVVLLAGRIAEGKGHADLVEAMRSLAPRKSEFAIVFAGATVEPRALDKALELSREFGLRDRIVMAGELPPERLRDWYAASDVVVLPSRSEGLGRVLLEAQAMGRPVVAYDCGGMPAAIERGRTGYLVAAGDVAGLGRQIEYLLDNPEARSTMGKAGREFIVRNYSGGILVDSHERFYLSILASRAIGGRQDPVARTSAHHGR